MAGDDFTLTNFAANLKLASSYYPSVSETCRRLAINRQQFMKYLAGTSFPSRHNLRRICDFFGVDEYEILMPQDQFRKIVRLRPNRGGEDVTLPPRLPRLLAEAQRHRATLGKTHGYYYGYYHSFSLPGHILRSLVLIYGWNDYTVYKRLERVRHPREAGPPDVYKYAGIVSVVGDRIHMIDQETLTGSELTQTILFLNYRNRVTVLTGLTMGVSGADAHQPSAARIVMEYLGRNVNRRHAIAGCRLYPEDSEEISDHFRRHLTAGGRIPGPLRAAIL
ncbi:MAG: helix-turn-helix transcriptional regulator [Rhodospirillaceae bacterium]|nr:helix-turn-helix transcriptional regulator [Rhodospirillaceae bacterium]